MVTEVQFLVKLVIVTKPIKTEEEQRELKGVMLSKVKEALDALDDNVQYIVYKVE